MSTHLADPKGALPPGEAGDACAAAQRGSIMRQNADILTRLADTIQTRLPAHGGDPSASYVARLLAQAPDACLKKIGEEATELVMAAKDGLDDNIVFETADLWFHSLIVLARFGLRPEAVLQELARREGVSGLTEKAGRKEYC